MSEIVIKAENISKQYQLGKIGYGTLKHDLQSWWARVRGKEDPNNLIGRGKHKDLNQDFWALKDISFEIKQGESVGIIGKNGAGKSTLLKILSRTTSPTSGSIFIKGKITSLLEVGTGFHPDLTGRENVYLNGAILGMKKREINRKFDEIVDFSGIEQFIDTPVKRYSSGMYVRLAFAVAAHLESDILILDEVLAVGDADFQKKCYGKMDDVSKGQGRTVLFVSHSIPSIKMLCKKCILLSKGELIYNAPTEETLLKYSELLRKDRIKENCSGAYTKNRRGSGTISFSNIRILDKDNNVRNEFFTGEKVCFELSYNIYKTIIGLSFTIGFLHPMTKETMVESRIIVFDDKVEKGSKGCVIIEVSLDNIKEGEYSLYFWMGDKEANFVTTPTHYDIIDDDTLPLIIKSVGAKMVSGGYFTLPYKLLSINNY